jgi:anthranilate synthase component 1
MLLPTATIQTLQRELPADLETPVSVYLKLRDETPSFLLESVEGGERVARYSFIGIRPQAQYILRDGTIEVIDAEGSRTLPYSGDPTQFLQAEVSRYATPALPGAPRFRGGLVGYLGYEAVRYFEPCLQRHMGSAPQTPDGIYLLADTIVAFDHARRSLFLETNVLDGDLAAAERKLDEIAARLRAPLPAPTSAPVTPGETSSNLSQTQFEGMVAAAKEHIAAGDIFQVVLSQQFTRRTGVAPFEVYRAARRLNPSPYMFFFDFGKVDGESFYLVGSSPEMFVRLEEKRASLRPIAGTRPRGVDVAADAALAAELLADPKERAEHVMLLDLGRNDIGRVCDYGSVCAPELFTIEKYSHVMHIVSQVEGNLRPGLTAFDLVRAAFPAGTVSGAPKVRAMEIISVLEPTPRGVYAGTVGYFGFDGNMDTCLAIRTMVGRGNSLSVQAGAGIVADSDPTAEYYETLNKAKAMLRAIEAAEQSS